MPHETAIKQRLSLRKPLQEALDILVRLADVLTLEKDTDVSAELAKVRELYPTCTDFERAFPSLCFSIATGVGKTRLMGAFIAYLHLQHGIRNFFVLAPNLTIYEKLIEDFGNPGHPKYVFQGLSEFVHNRPVVITGENYQAAAPMFEKAEVRINVFNIAKFNRDASSPSRGKEKGALPRIKRLSEYFGQSYWEYLSKLDDLVVLMDEAHRYHADASRSAINELRPVLGLELTATPIDEGGNVFRNVVYEYSLASALDGALYVKNPAVATRKDFKAENYNEAEIENIKLEDGISLHENTKQALKLYALNTSKPIIKPLLLVVCRDIAHAESVQNLVNSDNFFKGEYKGKVLQIDSSTNGEEVERLFHTLESAENPIEIVIHVNKLKEGWDVANLYTIVPLRAANAPVLVEQTIGRGLRLPYGERTGVEAVDKLTVVAHDNFQNVIQAAQHPDSILRKLQFIELSDEDLERGKENVTTQSTLQAELELENTQKRQELAAIAEPEERQQRTNAWEAEKIVREVINEVNSRTFVGTANGAAFGASPPIPLQSASDLHKPEVKAVVMEQIKARIEAAPQHTLFAGEILAEAQKHYTAAVERFTKQIIEIPRITIRRADVIEYFENFDLDTSKNSPSGTFHFTPLTEEVVVLGLVDGKRDLVAVQPGVHFGTPEEMLLVALLDYPEIDYGSCSALLHKLIGQALAAVRLSNSDEANARRTVFQWKNIIAQNIYEQMKPHLCTKGGEYEKPEIFPFSTIRPWHYTKERNNDNRKALHDESFAASLTSKYIFFGFKKACHAEYKFDSRSEQTFAYILEYDNAVQKWLRPAPGQFALWWNKDSWQYEPDFVVETADSIYIVEIKAAKDMDADDVQEKARAAKEYCKYATEFTAQSNGKQWKYALVSHNYLVKNMSFEGLLQSSPDRY